MKDRRSREQGGDILLPPRVENGNRRPVSIVCKTTHQSVLVKSRHRMSDSKTEYLLDERASSSRNEEDHRTLGARVFSYVFLCVVFLSGSIGGGLTLLGSPFLPLSSATSGTLSTANFFGMVVLVFLSTLGFMLAVQEIPNLRLLDRKALRPADMDWLIGHKRQRAISPFFLVATLFGCIAGMYFSLAQMIRPEDTFTIPLSSIDVSVGTSDPHLVAVGAFLFAAAGFSGLVALSVLLSPWLFVIAGKLHKILSSLIADLAQFFFFIALYALLL